jgi:hypothetical protein
MTVSGGRSRREGIAEAYQRDIGALERLQGQHDLHRTAGIEENSGRWILNVEQITCRPADVDAVSVAHASARRLSDSLW